MVNPCWQCERREVRCHVECEDYQRFVAECAKARMERHRISELFSASSHLIRNMKRQALENR